MKVKKKRYFVGCTVKKKVYKQLKKIAASKHITISSVARICINSFAE